MNAIPMPQTLPTPRPRSHHRMSAHKAAAAVRATLRGEAGGNPAEAGTGSGGSATGSGL